MKRTFTVKPKAKVTATSHARDSISSLERRLDNLKARLSEPDLSEDERIDLGQEVAELEEQINFAWQDDEAEYMYALEQQEFNPDGSLKGYDDYEEPDNDLYVIKIWHEVEANGEDTYGPEAAEEIVEYYADSPDQALEYAKRDWDGPIDRIEIVGVNPQYDENELPYASTDVKCSNDFLSDEDKEILRKADTSDWSKMQTERQEDEINRAGGYDKYVKKEKKCVNCAEGGTVTSGCSFDFKHNGNYDTKAFTEAVEDAFVAAGVTPIGVDFREVDYTQYGYKDGEVSQGGVDFEWSGDSGYYEEAIEDELASALDSLGCELLGTDFYSIEAACDTGKQQKVEAAEETYTYEDFYDSDIENEIAYKLGLYIDWSAVRGDHGPIYICDDPDHENDSDMWDGSDEDILRKIDFNDYKAYIEKNILTHPQEEWAKLYKSYLQDLGDPTLDFDEE